MSMEYTLDIQLTELGFPDVLQPQDASVSQAPSDEPSSPSLSAKRRRLLGDGQEAAAQPTRKSSASPHLPETAPCKSSTHAESRDSRAVNGAAVEDPTSEPPRVAEREEGGQRLDEEKEQEETTRVQQDVEEDSDDSEVSEIYEEEELDEEEDDDDDEELSNETSNSGDFRCSVCDLQLPSKFKLQDHMNLHTGARPYCCAECGKRFCQIYNYRVHLRTHAKTKVERHWCRICLTGFGSQEHLKRHLSRNHFEDLFYECDLCKRVFTSLKECEAHVQLHKCIVNIVCDVCGRKFPSEKTLLRHRKKSCLRSFKCSDCPKTFTKKNALLKHSYTHLGLLPYTCILCRLHFRLAKLYRQHKCEPERIHCVACLREFLSQEDFQQHKKDTGCWGNQEPNQRKDEIRCLECGQRFDTSEELKRHAGAHQRVLKCAECGKGFRSALLLMSHMGGHAGKSPCFCQTCGLGFPHQQNYDGHLKTCGQPSQSVSDPKMRKTLKSSLPEQTLKKKPNSSNISSTVTVPGVVLNNPAASEKDSRCPGPVAGGQPAGSGPSDGLWSLTLDKDPPLGMNLVLFLPVCPTQTSGLSLASAVPQTLPVAAVQPLPQASPSPASNNELFGVKGAFGASLNTPLQLLTGVKGDSVAPLDLSKKCNSSKSEVSDVPLPPIKSEPVDFEVSGQANGTETQEAQKHSGREEIIKTDAGETGACGEAKRCETDPVAPRAHRANTASPGLVPPIKNEPESPGPDSDAPSPASILLTDCEPEKDFKKEV